MRTLASALIVGVLTVLAFAPASVEADHGLEVDYVGYNYVIPSLHTTFVLHAHGTYWSGSGTSQTWLFEFNTFTDYDDEPPADPTVCWMVGSIEGGFAIATSGCTKSGSITIYGTSHSDSGIGVDQHRVPLSYHGNGFLADMVAV